MPVEEDVFEDLVFPDLQSSGVGFIPDHSCTSLRYNGGNLTVKVSPCDLSRRTLCGFPVTISCDDSTAPSSDITGTTLDSLLDSMKKEQTANTVAHSRRTTRTSFQKLDMVKTFPQLFDLLWASTMPCLGSSSNPYQVIKSCRWKGKDIDCAAIFDVFPTGTFISYTLSLILTPKNQEMVVFLGLEGARHNATKSCSLGTSRPLLLCS